MCIFSWFSGTDIFDRLPFFLPTASERHISFVIFSIRMAFFLFQRDPPPPLFPPLWPGCEPIYLPNFLHWAPSVVRGLWSCGKKKETLLAAVGNGRKEGGQQIVNLLATYSTPTNYLPYTTLFFSHQRSSV